MPARLEGVGFRGKSGLIYLMTKYPWRHPLPSGPGVYLATNLVTVAGRDTLGVIYVGETLDLSTAFLNHPRRGCLAKHTRKSKCICPNPFPRWREGVVGDLVAAYDPPCNEPIPTN